MNLDTLSLQQLGQSLSEITDSQVFELLLQVVKSKSDALPLNNGKKRLYYISAEFLIGKLLSNNLINLGIYNEVKEQLSKAGHSLEDIEELEVEPSLGNGGLGRLAACFIDSMSTLGLPGDGVGLKYHFGLFHQKFLDRQQSAVPDAWLSDDRWLEDEKTSFTVEFRDFSVTSELYSIDVLGYDRTKKNRLRLFDLQSIDDSLVSDDAIDFDKTALKKNLTLFLYPDDSDEDGQLLRVYQQYFMVSNAAQLIVKEAVERGSNIHDLADYVVIQINDTHPTMVIPELIRILTEKYEISFEESVDIVSSLVAYTNHTILAEALEKWPVDYLEKVVPQLMPIIRELDARIRREFSDERVYIIDNQNRVHMAHIDIHYGYAVNGVAALHTEILKNSELKPFYDIYPEKFNNKTNGITFRRWLIHCNHELSEYLNELIGPEYMDNAENLEKLLAYKDDENVLKKLREIKKNAKIELKKYLKQTQNIDIDENSVFDIQIKRLHEYKRQQMNALYAIYKYKEIKKGHLPKRPITMIFGAKAAPAYTIAKDIIHLILCLQQLVDNDPAVSPYLKIVMVENYNVTKAEKLIPACDISEQISLASKEASGTGNMKFMLNGAVTLGTEDGANVEIHELVGDDNIYIFGKKSEDVIKLYETASYRSADIYDNDPEVEELVDFIISKELIRIGDPMNLCRLYKEIVGKDWFMALLDVKDYIKTKEQMLNDYEDEMSWSKKALVNIAKAGFFSSDRTIAEYNKDIWHL